MELEDKMRFLAQQDATLASFFFTDNQIRWFDLQLQPNYLAANRTCARVRRISTLPLYSKETLNNASILNQVWIRLQIDVLDYSASRAKAAARAIVNWLTQTADFSSTNQFDSPPTSPKRHPNFLLNQMPGMEPKTQPPVFVQMLDVRILNLEEE